MARVHHRCSGGNGACQRCPPTSSTQGPPPQRTDSSEGGAFAPARSATPRCASSSPPSTELSTNMAPATANRTVRRCRRRCRRRTRTERCAHDPCACIRHPLLLTAWCASVPTTLRFNADTCSGAPGRPAPVPAGLRTATPRPSCWYWCPPRSGWRRTSGPDCSGPS